MFCQMNYVLWFKIKYQKGFWEQAVYVYLFFILIPQTFKKGVLKNSQISPENTYDEISSQAWALQLY